MRYVAYFLRANKTRCAFTWRLRFAEFRFFCFIVELHCTLHGGLSAPRVFIMRKCVYNVYWQLCWIFLDWSETVLFLDEVKWSHHMVETKTFPRTKRPPTLWWIDTVLIPDGKLSLSFEVLFAFYFLVWCLLCMSLHVCFWVFYYITKMTFL